MNGVCNKTVKHQKYTPFKSGKYAQALAQHVTTKEAHIQPQYGVGQNYKRYRYTGHEAHAFNTDYFLLKTSSAKECS